MNFPACGNVNGSILGDVGFNGNYWSSSINDTTNARNFNFNPNNVNANNSNNRYYGLCVRAVCIAFYYINFFEYVYINQRKIISRFVQSFL